MSSVNDTGWRGMMHFAIPVALPEGTDPEEFGEELALVIEWGLAGGIGNGSEALTGDCRWMENVATDWHPPLKRHERPLRLVAALKGVRADV